MRGVANSCCCAPRQHRRVRASLLGAYLWGLLLTAGHAAAAETAEAEILPSEFFYNVDGAAVSVGEVHACAIEHRDGREDFGGHVACWGGSHSDQTEAPDVSSPFLFAQLPVAETRVYKVLFITLGLRDYCVRAFSCRSASGSRTPAPSPWTKPSSTSVHCCTSSDCCRRQSVLSALDIAGAGERLARGRKVCSSRSRRA